MYHGKTSESYVPIGQYITLLPVKLKGCPNVTDIRNYGLASGITLNAYPGEPARRPYEVAMKMWEKGFYVRYGGDTIQLGLPFIVDESQIDSLTSVLSESLSECAQGTSDCSFFETVS